jgi:anti-sigma B factor antagonist
MEAHVHLRTADGVPVLDVAGELDLYTSPKLKEAVDAVLGEGHTRLIINLLETKYLDSTALSLLSTALQEIRRAGGNLALVYNQPQISRMFAITGLAEVFPTYASEAEAVAAAGTWVPAPPMA